MTDLQWTKSQWPAQIGHLTEKGQDHALCGRDVAGPAQPALYLKDNFISVAHFNIRDPHWTNQRLSRAAHCNFMIFAKRLRHRH